MRKTLLLTSMVVCGLTVAGCQEKSSGEKAGPQSPAQNPAQGAVGGQGGGQGGGGGPVRAACQAEIEKLCAGEERAGRCLRNHLDALSEGCRTTIESRSGR